MKKHVARPIPFVVIPTLLISLFSLFSFVAPCRGQVIRQRVAHAHGAESSYSTHAGAVSVRIELDGVEPLANTTGGRAASARASEILLAPKSAYRWTDPSIARVDETTKMRHRQAVENGSVTANGLPILSWRNGVEPITCAVRGRDAFGSQAAYQNIVLLSYGEQTCTSAWSQLLLSGRDRSQRKSALGRRNARGRVRFTLS
jgi:hypothetical protein